MASTNKMVCYGLVTLFTLALQGCAPSTTNKPDPSSAASGAAKPGADQRAGEGKTGAARESTTPGTSSLDQLREGKSTATPGSSPLKDVFFEFDRYDLRADARDTLRANADWLKGNAAARVEIEGHCDERGTNEYNLALGAKRAQAAKDYLVTLGIPADRLSTISYGEEVSVCKELSEGCWGQNRRARFVIVPGRPAS
jgi:peptidoglycan-associated lipoprotein